MVLPSRGHRGQTGFEQHEGQYDDRMFSFLGGLTIPLTTGDMLL